MFVVGWVDQPAELVLQAGHAGCSAAARPIGLHGVGLIETVVSAANEMNGCWYDYMMIL